MQCIVLGDQFSSIKGNTKIALAQNEKKNECRVILFLKNAVVHVDIEVNGRNPQKAHLAPLLNPHPKFQPSDSNLKGSYAVYKVVK